ncbi:hypothetical protein BKA69DRAFT_1128229 [Paraphysoderma sedebokerense]|nr:hypothetical protein BKA69DRAFT_1128229 [Paraphysoderma sedebokerense]
MSLVSITLSDFLSASLSLIFHTVHYVHREVGWEWCQISGFFCCIMGASALSFCVMGVERYLQIVHQKPFTKSQVSILLVICWVFALILALFPIISQTYHVPQSAPVYCLPDFRGRTVLHYIVSVSSIAAIVSVIAINSTSYYMIYKKTLAEGFKWSSALQFGSSSGESRPGSSSAVHRMNSVRRTLSTKRPKDSARNKQMVLTAKLAMITMSFCLAWIGSGVSFTYQTITGNAISAEIDIACTASTFLFAVFNPLMVLTMDKRWRTTSLSMIFGKKNEQINSQTASVTLGSNRMSKGPSSLLPLSNT